MRNVAMSDVSHPTPVKVASVPARPSPLGRGINHLDPPKDEQHQQDQRDQADDSAKERDLHQEQHDRDNDQQSDNPTDHSVLLHCWFGVTASRGQLPGQQPRLSLELVAASRARSGDREEELNNDGAMRPRNYLLVLHDAAVH